MPFFRTLHTKHPGNGDWGLQCSKKSPRGRVGEHRQKCADTQKLQAVAHAYYNGQFLREGRFLRSLLQNAYRSCEKMRLEY